MATHTESFSNYWESALEHAKEEVSYCERMLALYALQTIQDDGKGQE